jgi:hypothetical protein
MLAKVRHGLQGGNADQFECGGHDVMRTRHATSGAWIQERSWGKSGNARKRKAETVVGKSGNGNTSHPNPAMNRPSPGLAATLSHRMGEGLGVRALL